MQQQTRKVKEQEYQEMKTALNLTQTIDKFVLIYFVIAELNYREPILYLKGSRWSDLYSHSSQRCKDLQIAPIARWKLFINDDEIMESQRMSMDLIDGTEIRLAFTQLDEYLERCEELKL